MVTRVERTSEIYSQEKEKSISLVAASEVEIAQTVRVSLMGL